VKILVAFDKFKDSLTALQACEIAARALRGKHPSWTLDLCPLSDGGDGFAEIFTRAAGGQLSRISVVGPRGGRVEAALGLAPPEGIPAAARAMLALPSDPHSDVAPRTGPIAVIEMASASGLALLAADRRDPWQATTFGTGQLIRAAAELKAMAIVLGVGGSATNDLGLGALCALGLEFHAADGKNLFSPVPADWPRLASIGGGILGALPPIRIACDVNNPLFGPNGAAAVFGRQKGLKPEDHDRFEAQGRRVAAQLCDFCGQSRSLVERPGTGAAGGIAFGLMVAARARLIPGFPLASTWLDLDARLAAADMVITGEGRFDASSLAGKGPGALAARARELGKPAHVFAGRAGAGGPSENFLHSITPDGMPLDQALRETAGNLARAVEQSF
jgi:glycerate kinase